MNEKEHPVSDQSTDTDVQQHSEAEDFLVALSRAVPAEVLDRAAEGLAAVAAAVKEHQKKGSLVLRIEVSPMKNRPDAVEVIAKSTTSAPQPAPRARFMWPTEDGRLLTNDPRQDALPGMPTGE